MAPAPALGPARLNLTADGTDMVHQTFTSGSAGSGFYADLIVGEASAMPAPSPNTQRFAAAMAGFGAREAGPGAALFEAHRPPQAMIGSPRAAQA